MCYRYLGQGNQRVYGKAGTKGAVTCHTAADRQPPDILAGLHPNRTNLRISTSDHSAREGGGGGHAAEAVMDTQDTMNTVLQVPTIYCSYYYNRVVENSGTEPEAFICVLLLAGNSVLGWYRGGPCSDTTPHHEGVSR